MGRVVVVGAVNVDFVVAAERLPGPGETVVGPRVERFGGGKGANAAVAAARAGADVTLIGAVGDDDTGRAALDELRADGVRVDGVAVLDGVPTGVALIVVDAAGENQIAVGAGANAGVERDRVRAALLDALPRHRLRAGQHRDPAGRRRRGRGDGGGGGRAVRAQPRPGAPRTRRPARAASRPARPAAHAERRASWRPSPVPGRRACGRSGSPRGRRRRSS